MKIQQNQLTSPRPARDYVQGQHAAAAPVAPSAVDDARKVSNKNFNSDSAIGLQKRVLIDNGIAVTTKICSGGQAQVFRGFNCTNGSPLAVKIVPKTRPNLDEFRRAVLVKNVTREKEILQRIHHPNSLDFVGFIEDDENWYLVTEYLAGLDLFEEACKRSFPEKEILLIAKQIFEVLAYLHANGIAHRDVKLENVVLTKQKGSSDVKLIDYGLAFCEQFDKSTTCEDFPGTSKYKAPELVVRQPYRPQPVDVWSMGVMMFVLCCGEFPFDGKDPDAIYRNIVRKEPSFTHEFWMRISHETAHLISLLLTKDANTRPTAVDALEMLDGILNERVQVPATPRSRKTGFLSKLSGKLSVKIK
ncbi:Calcium-dependent protein kinase 1 [Porphyridium purpureum]|uniref:Calcium-dependent protein kinase 1 n=1 Tax=Porphyridium purpureum TaxID=35688 RepID=A0A5J4Z509_PORPP|nr:Calcium-dependent protein kinase 1 [Porphyridium purpureum]|eukprot:POR8408..scf295_1